jgi:SAM-dependent methyltransferase
VSEQRGIASFHVDHIHHAEQALMVQILDNQAALPGVVRMRRWAREALAVQPGHTALDVGSGTGTEVTEFAHLVGASGRAIGVDPNPAMLAVARERAGDRPVEFLEGSAYALPLPDACVDVVRCERVYQHLDEPAQATAEIARVLRPGGRVVLIDSDWSTAIYHPGDATILAAIQDRPQSATGPNRNSGRHLRGLLVAAGFGIEDIGSEAVIWDPDAITQMNTMLTGRGVAEGVISEAEADRLRGEVDRGIAAGDYHFSVTMFAVVARKP